MYHPSKSRELRFTYGDRNRLFRLSNPPPQPPEKESGSHKKYKTVEDYKIDTGNLKPATFKDLFDTYPIIAAKYCVQSGGKCNEERVSNIINGCRMVLQTLHLPETMLYRDFNYNMLDEFIRIYTEKGRNQLTIWSYCYHIKSLAAAWTKIPYEQQGLLVEKPTLKMPPKGNYRYETKSPELKRKVKELYASLFEKDPSVWFFMTMMLMFAMRNGDVKRLTWDNFIETPHGVFLKYTPHKTRLTSARKVTWPIPQPIWEQILKYKENFPKKMFNDSAQGTLSSKYRDERGRLNSVFAVEKRLNGYMRGLGFTGSKGAYELRKLCADTMYSKFGHEMASSITGDDIRTITHYYADPGAVSKVVNIADML